MHSSLVSPNSQIIHLVNASVDTLDALPPNLTRSISDLRELDAVLATNLDQITNNLNLLHKMMVNPDQFNQQDRLRLLRLVTDLTRQFRRAHGVEDKIRVATNTTETVSTSCTQLSTISALLLDYIPTIETPHPATTYGLPLEPNSATARRQAIMGEEAQLISQYGSTGRRQGALAIAVPGMRLNPATDPSRAALSHPNGHPSLTGPPPILGMNGHPTHARVQSVNGLHNGVRAQAQAQSNGLHPGAGQEWRPVTAVDAVREKKRKGRESGYDEDEVYDSGEFAPRAPAKRQKGAAAAPAANDNHPLPALPALPANGHPPPDLPTAHAPAPPKKAAARRKPAKQAAATAVPLPTAPVAATLPPPAAIPDRAVAVDKVPVEVISAGEVAPEVEDQDLYCFCQTPSYGEMIGCDRDECERQWFHLPCVGLKAIPKGSWYCDDCVAIRNRPADNKKAAKRR